MPDLEPLGQGEGSDWTAAVPEGGALEAPALPLASDTRSAIELLRKAGAPLPEPGDDGGVGGEPIVAPSAPVEPIRRVSPIPPEGTAIAESVVSEDAARQAAKEGLTGLGEPIMRARAAREADRAGLPERQRKFLDSRGEVQRAVGEAAKEVAPLRLDDGQRSRLKGLQGTLGVLHNRVTPLPDSLVAEKAGRRGALSEADVAARQMTVSKWNEEVACQQAVLESLDVGGKAAAAIKAQRVYTELGREYENAAQTAAEAGERFKLEATKYLGERQRMGNLVRDGALSQEEADQLLVTKETPGRALSEQVAALRVQEEEANLRAAEANVKAEALRVEEEAAWFAAREVEGMIVQRRAGIDAAVAEMTVSDGITNDTRQRLERAGKRIGRSQVETGQKLEANRIAGDIQEMQAFVDRIAGVRILPGGLDNQLKLLDQRIDYLRQPGTIENLDPALAGAVEDTVDAFGGGDAGRDRYLAKLLADRTNLQLLIDIERNPMSLADGSHEGIPQVLSNGLREAGNGEGVWAEKSSDPKVNELLRKRNESLGKVVEWMGVKSPLRAKEEATSAAIGEALKDWKAPQEARAAEAEAARAAAEKEIRESGMVVSAKSMAEQLTGEAVPDDLILEGMTAEQQIEAIRNWIDEKIGNEVGAEVNRVKEEMQNLLDKAKAEAEAARERARQAQQRAGELEPVAGEANEQVRLALESAVNDLGAASIPDNLKAPLVAGETLASRLAAIEAWKNEELKRQMDEEKRGLGVKPETGKAGDGKEHENSVKRAEGVLTKFARGEVNEKTVRQTVNELRQIPGVGAALAESLTKMVDRLVANRSSLSDNDVTEVIGKDGKMRKLLGAPELAGIGAGAVAGMLPLFEGMFNTALASMGLAGR